MPRKKGTSQKQPTKKAKRTRKRRVTISVSAQGGNFLARVYKQEQIPHKFVLWVYREIRSLVEEATLVVGRHTTFLDHFFIDCYLKLANGSLRNESIFRKETLTHETSQEHRAHKIAMMRAGIEFIHTQASGVGAEGRNFDSLYRLMPFDPAVYNILLESFVRAVQGYMDWERELINLRVRNDTSPEALVRRSDLERAMTDCEERVGCDRGILGGVIRQALKLTRLITRYQERVARAYERIVLQMAKQYGRSAMQIEDNFQWGSFGLQRAIRYFDPGRGKSFSGIARWWIRAAILLKIKDEVNLVQVPARVWKQYEKYEAKAHQLNIQGDLAAIGRVFGHTYAEVEEVYNAVHINRPRSMEDPLTNSATEDGGRLGEKITDDKPNPDERLEEKRDKRAPLYLQRLTVRQRKVICCSFGLFEFYPGTDGDKDSIVREKLRQAATTANLKYREAV